MASRQAGSSGCGAPTRKLTSKGGDEPKARASAERALQLDPELAEAHTSLAAILADYYWEWEAAEKSFQPTK